MPGALSAAQADAEVRVDGGRDEMQVRVENDTVGHVLEALGHTVSLHCRSAAPLNKVIGGSFSGSLEQVLSRVLAGYDFVVRYNLRAVEILVVEKAARRPSRLRRWRTPAASDSAYGHRRGRA